MWSLALGTRGVGVPQVERLARALTSGEDLRLTGTILQETIQGFARAPTGRRSLERYLRSFPLVQVNRSDYVAAAALYDDCRAGGVQLGTVDAQIAAVAIARGYALLTTDRDFVHAGKIVPLKLA